MSDAPIKLVVVSVDELRELIREEVTRAMAHKAPANDKAEASYVSAEVLQKHFGVSRATVHAWVHTEGCPHKMRGRILRFKLADVEAWFTRRRSRKRGRPAE